VESIDMVEVLRRIEEGIYDQEEYEKALEWTKEYAKEGVDPNPEDFQRTKEQKEEDWEFTVKTAIIVRDLMIGNENLSDDYSEEALGHNAIAAGFQGQRQWTDRWANADYTEAILNTSFDWNG